MFNKFLRFFINNDISNEPYAATLKDKNISPVNSKNQINSQKSGTKNHKIILCAGGTGGHFFPAVTLAKELIARGFAVIIITDMRCQKYTKSYPNLEFYISDIYIQTSSIFKIIKSTYKILKSYLRNVIYLKKVKPSLVIGFGGYPTLPPLFAARTLRIPIMLHEQNSFVGKTNRIFVNYASCIATSFQETFNINNNNTVKSKTNYVGDIIRPELKIAENLNNFQNPKLRIFIFGGSQGAKIFSQIIPSAIKQAIEIDPNFTCEITQQIKPNETKLAASIYDSYSIKYEFREFFEDMTKHYLASDIVICRSGASTIAELSYLKMPAILIPFPFSAEDHQLKNAQQIAKLGGGFCISEDEYTSKNVAKKLTQLNQDRSSLAAASKAISSRTSNGAENFVNIIQQFLA